MTVLVIVLLVAALVVAASAAFIAVDRQRREIPLEPPPAAPRLAPRPASVDVLEPDVLEPDLLEPHLLEPEVLEPEVEERVSVRDRLGKARGLLAGYFGSVRSRPGIDQETWD